MKKEELYSATLLFDKDNVLTVTFKDHVDVTIKEAHNLIDVSLKMVDNHPFYLLCDARNIISTMDHEARKYIAEHKEYNRLNIGQAIIVNTVSSKVIANFYFKFYKHINPVKIFNDYSKGRSWLFNISELGVIPT